MRPRRVRGALTLVAGISIFAIAASPVIGQDWNVEVVGQISGYCEAVQIAGDYVFAGIGPTVHVVDIAQPSSPTEVASLCLSHGLDINDLVLSGDLLIAASASGEVYLLDVSDPLAPASLSSFASPAAGRGAVTGVCATGGYAYFTWENLCLCDYGGGLVVLDIADPTGPVRCGSYDTGVAKAVDVLGNLAYVATKDNGLQIIDVSDPSSPTIRGCYMSSSSLHTVRVSGHLAYVGGVADLLILDVSDPSSPAPRGSHAFGPQPCAIDLRGDLAFVAWGERGLQIFDIITAPPFLQPLAALDTPYFALDVQVSANVACVADGWGGLQIIDVADPSSPTVLWSPAATIGDARGIDVVGDLVYVADRQGGLRILDVSNPALPVYRGAYDLPGCCPANVRVVDGLAYVASGVPPTGSYWSGVVHIIDVTDPSFPVLRGSYDTPRFAHDVCVVDNLAYVAAEWRGFYILDVSDPSSPCLHGHYPVEQRAYGISVSSPFAYIAAGYNGLEIYDVTRPSSPTLYGSYHTSGETVDLCISNGLAYLAANTDPGLVILDVTKPARPTPLGAYEGILGSSGVDVDAGLAYIVDSFSAAVCVIDVADPTSPVLRGSFDLSFGQWGDVQYSDGLIYVADNLGGVWILRYTPPQQPSASDRSRWMLYR